MFCFEMDQCSSPCLVTKEDIEWYVETCCNHPSRTIERVWFCDWLNLMWILFLKYLTWSGIARIWFDWINCSWTFLAYWNARIIRLLVFTLKVLQNVLMRKEEKYYSVSQERRPATVNCCVILISLWFRCFKELVVVSTITLLKCCTYLFYSGGEWK